MAQTRTVAPASGMPRELKTMSSLREPCACAGATAPGNTCSANASNAQRNPIAILHRIIERLLSEKNWSRYPFLLEAPVLVSQRPMRPGDSVEVSVHLSVWDIYRFQVRTMLERFWFVLVIPALMLGLA